MSGPLEEIAFKKALFLAASGKRYDEMSVSLLANAVRYLITENRRLEKKATRVRCCFASTVNACPIHESK